MSKTKSDTHYISQHIENTRYWQAIYRGESFKLVADLEQILNFAEF
jgi:hypothetical protein